MTGALKTYAAFARLGFLEILQYRLRYVTGILTYLVYVSAYAFLWRGIYNGAESVRGFNVAAMTHFIALGWIFRSFYFNNIDREVADEVREGKIGTQLLKPVIYPVAKLVTALGESGFRLLFFTGPIAIVMGWLFKVPPPAGLRAAAGTAVSLLLAFLVMGGVNFLLSLAAFPLKIIAGLIHAKHMALQLLSGLLVPLSFFPPAAAAMLEKLPFAAISQAPVLIYLGRTTGGALGRVLLFQAAWAAALWILAALLWSRAVKRLTVQGG